jgi:hypothetical protein
MPIGRPTAAPNPNGASARQQIARRSDHVISAWPPRLHTIMICTASTGSSLRWNSMAPQIAEKAKPAMLETRAATKAAAIAASEADAPCRCDTTSA